MRKTVKNIFCSLFIITMMCGDGHARPDVVIDSDCPLAESGVGYFDVNVNPDFNNCATQSTETYYQINGLVYRVISCLSCPSGVTIRTETKTYRSVDLPDDGACQISYQTCGSCSGCGADCIDDPKWQVYLNIYKKRVFRDCECNTCVESPLYLCATDYYDDNNNGTSGVTNINLLNCKKCPAAPDCTEWESYFGMEGVESCTPNVPNGCTRTIRYRCKSNYYASKINNPTPTTTELTPSSLGCTACPTMADLESDTTTPWGSAEKTGYEIRSLTNPAPNVCSDVAQYRCAAGYYGTVSALVPIASPSSAPKLTGCTQCAMILGVQSTSVAGDNATRDKCCVEEHRTINEGGNVLEFMAPCCDVAE